MKADREKLIVGPRALRGFCRKSVVCVPYDPAPGILLAHIKKGAVMERRIGGSLLFELPRTAALYACLGAPAAVASLEPLIASGVRKILLLSFCGSLNPKFRIGDIISVSAAASDEGTSGRYLRDRTLFRPSPALRKTTESRLMSLGLAPVRARAVSTDAPYRETAAWLRAMQKKRLDVVDMEASAVFALAEYHGAEAAALFIVSDELFSGSWSVAPSRDMQALRIRECFLPFL